MSGFVAAARSAEPEWMDTEAVSYDDFRACLDDLERVNRLSLGYRPTLGFLEDLRRRRVLPAGRPLTVIDVGSGHGDGLRAVARWAARRGIPVRLVGVDINPFAARAAREAAVGLPEAQTIEWVTDDVFAFAAREDNRPDVILSALFAHHLSDPAVVRFVAWMEATAGIGWFVNDLHRHALSYHGFSLLARLLGMHRFVVHDGPISIARGFVRADWRAILRAAGVEKRASIRWWMPFRLCVGRIKP